MGKIIEYVIPSDFDHVMKTHAVLALTTFLVLFPLGVLLRIYPWRYSRQVHGLMQTFAYCTLICAVGMGIWMTKQVDISLTEYHPLIGLIVFSLTTIQYIGGFTHYLFWRRDRRQQVIAYAHEYFGRIVVALGMINGGLGLHFAGRVGTAVIVVYAVSVGVICSAYIAYLAFRVPYNLGKPKH